MQAIAAVRKVAPEIEAEPLALELDDPSMVRGAVYALRMEHDQDISVVVNSASMIDFGVAPPLPRTRARALPTPRPVYHAA